MGQIPLPLLKKGRRRPSHRGGRKGKQAQPPDIITDFFLERRKGRAKEIP